MWWVWIGLALVMTIFGLWRLDNNYFDNDLGFVLTFIGGIALFVILIVGAVNWTARVSCERAGDRLERSHRYGLIEGCYIQDTRGRFIPLENYRVTSEEP